MLKINAFQVAEHIDLKRFRKEYAGKENSYSASDIFYINKQNNYLFVLSYGVVVFSGYDEVKMSEFIDYLKPFCKKILNNKMSDEFGIYENSKEDRAGYNEIYVSQFNPNVMRIVMLNVGQSVALDYFSEQANLLLEETYLYTTKLEKDGKLDITTHNLMKFIGKTLNFKNRIIDNLYVIDSPDEIWENEYLCKVDNLLRNTFDLKIRFREIDYQLQIVKENLDLFKDLMHHRRSNMLEIIIILLILVEVGNLLFEKIFSFLIR